MFGEFARLGEVVCGEDFRIGWGKQSSCFSVCLIRPVSRCSRLSSGDCNRRVA